MIMRGNNHEDYDDNVVGDAIYGDEINNDNDHFDDHDYGDDHNGYDDVDDKDDI